MIAKFTHTIRMDWMLPGFVLSGESITQSGTWYEIKGKWVAEL